MDIIWVSGLVILVVLITGLLIFTGCQSANALSISVDQTAFVSAGSGGIGWGANSYIEIQGGTVSNAPSDGSVINGGGNARINLLNGYVFNNSWACALYAPTDDIPASFARPTLGAHLSPGMYTITCTVQVRDGSGRTITVQGTNTVDWRTGTYTFAFILQAGPGGPSLQILSAG